MTLASFNVGRRHLASQFVLSTEIQQGKKLFSGMLPVGNSRQSRVVLFIDAADYFRDMIEHISRESMRVGLKINVNKTKAMFTGLAREGKLLIHIQSLEPAQEYVLLGQIFTGVPSS